MTTIIIAVSAVVVVIVIGALATVCILKNRKVKEIKRKNKNLKRINVKMTNS